MRASLPKKDKLIPISEAALVLDISIDTVRRWDRKGILHSKRINGKNRYFSIDELEKVKFAKPLSISEASKYLGISPTTLRRLEVRGLIKPDRNEAGERGYNKESLEKFLNGEYFLRQKKIEEKILRPEEPEKEPPTHKVLAVLQQETGQEVSKLLNFRKAFYVGGALLLTTFILLVTFITVSFLLYPVKTAQFFGYRQNSNVLGVSYLAKEIQEKDQVLGQALKPLADFSLGVVSQIDKKTYEQIIPKKAILDVNDVLSVNEKGNLSVKYNFEFPDSSYLQMSDSGLVKNLNVEYVQGKVPGSGNGDLVVWGKDSIIEGLTIQAYDTIQEEGSSLTQRTTLNFAGAGFTATDDSSNLRTNVSMNSGLNNIAGLSLTDGNFIVGNGVNWVAESGSTARGSLGLGSIATQDASSVTITGGSITGITDLAVADGGTGSSTGSITGSSALTFTAGGTNQNVTLTPSGSGYTILNGNVGIGTASPAYLLQVLGNVGIGGSLTVTSGLALPSSSISNANLANSSLAVTAGSGLSGGGSVSLGGSTSLVLDLTNTNTWTGIQTFNQGIKLPNGIVTPAGNLGIGTSANLDYNLKVQGTGYFSDFVGIGTSLNVSGNVGIGGVFLASNGSASAPSYSFTNLTNAGLWTNGDGLLLTTGGTNTSGITVTGAGNVGIGTTAPSALFSVGSSSQFQINSSGAIAASTGISNSGAYTQTGTSANAFTGTSTFSNATYSALFTGGNVGIGTVSPVAQLDLRNTNTSTGLHMYVGSSAGQFGILDNGNVGIGTTNPGAKLGFAAATTAAGGIDFGGDVNLYRGAANVLRTDDSLGVYGSYIEGYAIYLNGGTLNEIRTINTDASLPDLYITPAGAGNTLITSGNAGIGTSATGSKLAVNGNGIFGWGTASVAGPSDGLAVSGNVGIGTTSPQTSLYVTGNAMIGYSSGAPGSLANGLAVSGNVGIGTTAPASYLHVAGGNSTTNNIRIGSASGTSGRGWIGMDGDNMVLSPNASSQWVNIAGQLTLPSNGGYIATGYGSNGVITILATSLDMDAKPITNIGNSGTDFDTSGGLALASNLTMADDKWVGLGASAGRIEFDNQDTDEVNILSANVGIGTAVPGAKLAVIGNVGIGTSAAGASLQVNGGGLFGWGTASVAGPANGLAVSGNVGIGTTSPQAALHVWGAGLYAATFLNGNVGIGTTSPVGSLHVKTTPPVSATGGTITYSGGYTIHTFTSSGTFAVAGGGNAEVLVVAGGGGGGPKRGGGGGGGGLVYTASYAVDRGNYTVTVGAGGSGGSAGSAGSDGGTSVFGTITATGGGGGGYAGNGRAGGSGGGGGSTDGTNGNGGSGTSGQGNSGGNALNGYGGAGGGGAGAAGANQTGGNGGAGGIGLSYSINGTATYYAGGGGGGEQYAANAGGAGGNGGGGAGGDINGTAGTASTGGGGGGSGDDPSYVGGAGGSGIVIIRYLTASAGTGVDSLVVSSTTGNVGIGTTATGFNTLQITGNVGIGTSYSNEGYSLDVAGKIRAIGFRGSCLNSATYTNNGNCNQDVAEVYQSSENVAPGDVLVIDTTGSKLVKRSVAAYDANIIGVVSTSPGLLLGINGQDVAFGGEANSYVDTADPKLPAVALSGKVSVKVSTENGPIKIGDYLTSSTTPGVAMRATKAGSVIGAALEDYSGAGIGKISVFIRVGVFNGVSVTNFLVSNDQPIWFADQSAPILDKLLAQKDQLLGQTLSEITTDRLVAGLEVIAPKVTTNTLAVSNIKPVSESIMLNLTDNGQFIIKNEASESAIIFDSLGNGTFKGTITADRIKANQIEGLELLVSSITSTGSTMLTTSTLSGAGKYGEATESAKFDAVSMEGLDKLTVGELYVKKATIFDGIVQVIESLTSRSLIVTDWAKFLADVLFKGDVIFEGRPTFNKDSAGGALIKQGADSVNVVFEKEYAQIPLVNISITLDEEITDKDRALLNPQELELRIKNYELREKAILGANISYIVVKRTINGFTIKLNQKAPEDLKFTWIALAVKDAKTAVSELLTSKESKPTFEVVLASPSATPSLSPSPTPEPSLTPSPTPSPTPLPSPSPSPSPPKIITVNQTELGYLRVRDGPATSYNEIGQINTGQFFEVFEESSDWYEIEYAKGQYGWVSGVYVTIGKD